MKYEIRPGTVEDIPNAIPLIQEFVQESISEYGLTISPDHAAKAIRRFVNWSLVLLYGDQIVGIIAGDFTDNFLTEEKIFQEQIWFVSKDHRRQGVRLIKELEKKLLLMGVNKLIMGYMANLKSEALHKFYEAMGFNFMEAHFMKNLQQLSQ
jgi:GNAT superfamily N-acetyltransferase